MILSSGTKKPKIHSSAYVAAGATISGDVEIGAGCAILHGAVLTAEGAPLRIGADTVVMENAVVKASGGSAIVFPCSIGNKCIVGPHAYVVGATIGNGCFIASGSRIFNGAVLADDAGVALGAIVHVGTHIAKGASVPMQHIAHGNPATIYTPDRAAEVHAKINFYSDVFNQEPGTDVRARAAESYARFLRKSHAQDKRLDDHQTVKVAPQRRLLSADEPPATQATDVGGVVDAMMLELQEIEHRRQEGIKKQKGGK
jgi:carbonic anhydrase/acetyltransferase-like protein (isoleucine patch superfamily)